MALQISGVRLTCLSSVCRYLVEEGKSCPVPRQLRLDDYDVTEHLMTQARTLSKREKALPLWFRESSMTGIRRRGGSVFEDAVFQRDFGYLDGKRVAVKADRIDVEFLL